MRARNEQGIALITVMLLLMLISTLLVGTTALVVKDQNARFQDHNRTSTFYVAHGGLEKLTNDLGRLFAGNYSPTDAQIKALTENPPAVPGMRFDLPGEHGAGKGYSITRGIAENKTLSSGDFAGLKGIVTPYTVSVTAKSSAKSEVTLVRTVNSVAIPVFQFGIFSETDLSFFAGPAFNFGGRVHTNGNLWLAKGGGSELILANKVTAYKDVITTELSNGHDVDTGYTGNMRVITQPGACDNGWTDGELCKVFDRTWGSLNDALEVNTTLWKDASDNKFGGNIKNGPGGKGGEANSTGAVKLTLPITQYGAQPIDLIRRPNPNENTANPNLYLQRYYGLASVRILLSDNADDLNNLPDRATDPSTVDPQNIEALPTTGPGPGPAKAGSGAPYLATAGQNLIRGFIKVEMQNQAGGTWTDVTADWLGKGYTGKPVFPYTGAQCSTTGQDAIIRLQRVKDSPAAGDCATQNKLVPNVLYDPREGRDRDTVPAGTTTTLYLSGVMHYVELDIKNLRIWLADQRAAGNIMETTGYVVYFSDRRNNHKGGTGVGTETGEYGYEDIVTRNTGTKDAGEDVNGNNKNDTFIETYGQDPTFRPAGAATPLDVNARPWHTISADQARANRAVLFRRALKLVNGGRAAMYHDKPANDPHGLTIVAENPVYIEGDYNADTPATEGAEPAYKTEEHVACAVIADAVTLLSKNWKDDISFTSPTSPGSRKAFTTTYRTAIVSGKGLAFDHFTGANDFGTDGGTHNFLRYIEGWNQPVNGKPSATLNYKGSIVSLYYNHQAVGTYKCCTTVYGPPRRQFFFDDDFTDQDKLPPRTPMFRAIDVTSFSRMNEPPPPPPPPPPPTP